MPALTTERARSLVRVHRVAIEGDDYVCVRTLPASELTQLNGAKELVIAGLLICDDEGTPIGDAVSDWPLWVVQRAVMEGLALNGLGDSVDELEKK